MKKLTSAIFLCSGKGGVGKTFGAIVLSSLLRALKIPHALANVEVHGQELVRFYPDALDLTMSEVAVNTGRSPLDKILEVLLKERSHLVVDTGANVGRGILEWMEGVGFLDLCAEEGIRVSFGVVVAAFDRDTLEFANKLYDYAGDDVTWYTLQATHTGDNFDMFSEIVAKSKATVIAMPSIWSDTMELSKRRAQPFLKLAADSNLDIAERQRSAMAARRFEEAFRPIIRGLFK